MYKIDQISKEKKRADVLKRVLSIVLYIIIIPIIVFNLTIIIKSFINPNKTPDFFGYKNFIIVSGSMEPTIMTGDAIIVKEVLQDELKEQDIISFHDGTSITTHRIISIVEENGNKKYITKGDNNNTEDKQKVTYDKIEGKYKFKLKGFGKIIKILQSKLTLLILVIVLVFTFWYEARLENRKKDRKEKRKNIK